MGKKRFYVEGMTCSGCEWTIEKAVSRLEGVCSVSADHRAGLLEVAYCAPCTETAIIQAIEETGYGVAEQPRRQPEGLYLLVILLGLSLIARHLGLTGVFQSFPTVSGPGMGYAALFAIGLLTSVHCIAMCGGLNLAQSLGDEAPHPLRGSILYNLGRLTSYTLIGGLLGFLGEQVAVTLRIRGFIGLGAGVMMLVIGVKMLGGFSWLRLGHFRLPRPVARGLAAFRAHGPYAIGLVNGLMPCGPLQSMQLYAIACGSFLVGAASMFFFCLGTIPLVLLFGTAAGVLKRKWRQRMLTLGAALLVLMGLYTMQNNLTLAGVTMPGNGGEGPVLSTVENGVQYVSTTLHSGSYDDIQVVAGIPVVWTISADESALNGCNNELVIPAFDQQVKLQEGTTTIEFTPRELGSFSYSCWMGMLRNTITVVGRWP